MITNNSRSFSIGDDYALKYSNNYNIKLQSEEQDTTREKKNKGKKKER